MRAKQITHLTFIDIETTGKEGPNSRDDAIVEIAVAKVNIQSREIELWYESLIKPWGYQTILSPAGLRWNFGDYHLSRGTFDRADWDHGRSLVSVLHTLQPIFNGATVAGNNPRFDLDHILRDYHYFAVVTKFPSNPPLTIPDFDYHVIDLCSPAMLLVMAGMSEGVSLRNTRTWAGLPGEQSHRAGQDVRDAIKVFFAMADVMKAGLQTWSTGPDSAPEDFELIQKYLGPMF